MPKIDSTASHSYVYLQSLHQEVETERSRVQGHPQLFRKPETWGIADSVSRKKKKEKERKKKSQNNKTIYTYKTNKLINYFSRFNLVDELLKDVLCKKIYKINFPSSDLSNQRGGCFFTSWKQSVLTFLVNLLNWFFEMLYKHAHEAVLVPLRSSRSRGQVRWAYWRGVPHEGYRASTQEEY